MSKQKSITEQDIFVSSEQDHSGDRSSDYRFNIWYYGEYTMNDLSAEDMKELIICMQHALDATSSSTTK